MSETPLWSSRRLRESAPAQTATPSAQEGNTLLGQTLKVRRLNDGNASFVATILAFDQGLVKLEVQPGQYSTTLGVRAGDRMWIPVVLVRDFVEIVEPPPAPQAEAETVNEVEDNVDAAAASEETAA